MKKVPKCKRVTTAEARAIIEDRIKVAERQRLLSDEARKVLRQHIEARQEKISTLSCARCENSQRKHMLVMCAEPENPNFGQLYRFCPPPLAVWEKPHHLEDVIRESIRGLDTPDFEPVQMPPFTRWERFCNWLSGC